MSTPSSRDPQFDPAGYVDELLDHYVPPGYVVSLIRTWVPIGIGALVAWLAVHWHIVIKPGASASAGIVTAGLVIAGYYALARLVERRWPRIGRWLVALNLVASKPVYARDEDAVRIIDGKTGTVRKA
jgi:hypothetical protein